MSALCTKLIFYNDQVNLAYLVVYKLNLSLNIVNIYQHSFEH